MLLCWFAAKTRASKMNKGSLEALRGEKSPAEVSMPNMGHDLLRISRRRFLFQMAAGGHGSGRQARGGGLEALLTALSVENPLSEYPNRGWDHYSWHTDLPPGHPMVTGQQTVDFDLCNAEYADLAIVWGMNWITTKMPDSHWLTEACMKGTKVVVIAAEY